MLVATTEAYISPSDDDDGAHDLDADRHRHDPRRLDGTPPRRPPTPATSTSRPPRRPSRRRRRPAATSNGDKTYYYKVTATYASGESLPGREASYKTPASGVNTNRITLNWVALPGATGYKIYRSTEAARSCCSTPSSAAAPISYIDNTTNVPAGDPPTTDADSGIGVAVAVNVAVVSAKAYLARNVSLVTSTSGAGVTVEATAPAASIYSASSISGAGGSSVGVAGSIAVNVVVVEHDRRRRGHDSGRAERRRT